MEIRQALTFDDVMLVPAASAIMPVETDTRSPTDARDRARDPAGLGGNGHGNRKRARDRDGAGRRNRRHPPQHGRRAAGRRSPQGQEVRGRDGRQPGHDPPRRKPRRCAAADGRPQDLRHPGRRARLRQTGRHPDQPRRAIRRRSASAGRRADDPGEADHRPRELSPAKTPSACCTSTASRSCSSSTRPIAASV